MRVSDSLVDDLETAIRAGSHERRAEILRSVTDLFLGNAEHYSPEQVDLFDDVLGQGTIAKKLREKGADIYKEV